MQRILIVDDNEAVRESLRDALSCEGYPVDAAATGAQAIAMARRTEPAVVLLDLRMPDLNGEAVAERLTESGRPVSIIVLSADRGAALDAQRMKAAGFMAKPFDLGSLLKLIERVGRSAHQQPAAVAG